MEHGIFGGYEGSRWLPILFELHNLHLGMESGLFFKTITLLSFADLT
jgi:hypothetical protein